MEQCTLLPSGCVKIHSVNWDDLRFILAVAKSGSLSGAASLLDVDHTTVGRRVESAETALGLSLFVRTPRGYRPTADCERLLAPMQEVEAAVHSLERAAQAHGAALDGVVRVTSPETLGMRYLAPRLASFAQENPELTVELMPVGEILNLSNREAEIAVRFFRSKHQDLVVQKVADVEYGFYASPSYLEKRPISSVRDLAHHALLVPPEDDTGPERAWLEKLCPQARASLVSTVSVALQEAAEAGAGIAILPHFLVRRGSELTRVPMPNPPRESIWLTIHQDLRKTPRVRALFEFLVRTLRSDASLLGGTP